MSDLLDAAARCRAVDPSQNIILEASAGTGKTRVLVDRYVNLLLAGVDPENILAITFTRKAAAEMRQRIVQRVKEASRERATSPLTEGRWRELRGRLADIAISTIDAFCLSLLREFPLEADVDPGFELADDTEVPRLVKEALDQALRICRARAREDDDVALVFAQLGERRLRAGLAALLGRRLVAPDVLRRYLARGPKDLSAARASAAAANRLGAVLDGVEGGLEGFLADGPLGHPHFAMLAADLRELCRKGPGGKGVVLLIDEPLFEARSEQAALRVLIDRLRGYFLTQQGEPRKAAFSGTVFSAEHCSSIGGSSAATWRRHRVRASAIAPGIADSVRAFRRDLNVMQSRGVLRIFAIAVSTYDRTLEEHALIDFSGVLQRALDLLRQMDEFARSRYRLEARYHHVLVDEFQDTSRAQWELVAQLARSWGEGLGASSDALPPSIFIVGDRKQSIYGFRDAEVAVFDDATTFIEALRPEGEARQAISVSFRAVPALLRFVNDVFGEIDQAEGSQTILRRDRFRFDALDRFPSLADREEPLDVGPALGLVVGDTVRMTASAVADEVVRLLESATIRDRQTGLRRQARPTDVAILFRSRDSHREFEAALDHRGVPTYVYRGLGFFEADEIQDLVALLRFLADPTSNLRASAFLRSRVIRLSDDGIMRLAPSLAAAVIAPMPPDSFDALSAEDQTVLARTRAAVSRWLQWVDRMTPAEVLDGVLSETAYACEWRGPRRLQSRENVKKLRGLIRRVQNRGYATLSRIAGHLDRLAVGDESNAAVDAIDAVSLMTVHAAKGLEFPIVFVVNIGRGTGGVRAPIRVATDASGEASVAIADYQSQADDDAQARDREETKRLLYVALTRARDRLYLSATVQDGVCRMGRGSLGEVLPQSLTALIAGADRQTGPCRGNPTLTWLAASGDAHLLTVS